MNTHLRFKLYSATSDMLTFYMISQLLEIKESLFKNSSADEEVYDTEANDESFQVSNMFCEGRFSDPYCVEDRLLAPLILL